MLARRMSRALKNEIERSRVPAMLGKNMVVLFVLAANCQSDSNSGGIISVFNELLNVINNRTAGVCLPGPDADDFSYCGPVLGGLAPFIYTTPDVNWSVIDMTVSRFGFYVGEYCIDSNVTPAAVLPDCPQYIHQMLCATVYSPCYMDSGHLKPAPVCLDLCENYETCVNVAFCAMEVSCVNASRI
jgi:hypothetical protein